MTPPLPRCLTRPTLPTLALAALLVSGAARGDEPNPWYFGASETLTHESNLYRIGTNAAGQAQTLPPGTSASDLVSNTALIGGIDQPFGRQRARGSINAGQSRYKNNRKLDTPTYTLDLALDWATIERFSGTLSLGARQSQAKYDTVTTNGVVATRPNVANNRNIEALGRMGLVSKLSIEARLGYSEVRYSAVDYQRNDYQQQVASLGINFRPSGLLTLGSALRQTRGEHPKFQPLGADQYLADNFTRNDLDFSANWQPSQVSQLTGRLSATRTHYASQSLRDSDATTGNLAWNWQPTGKLKLRTELRRDYGQDGQLADFGAIAGSGVVDYNRTSTTLRLSADEQISAKTSLTAAIQQAHRTLVNTAVVPAGTLATENGGDDTLTVSLGARWAPSRSTLLGCNLSREQRRTDSTLSTNLNAAVLGCFGQITLQ
jgi:hypothetical protein